MAATPPSLQNVAHTPSTPLHGAQYDDKRHHSTRKSSRQSSSRTQRAIETPPPNPDNLPNQKPLNSTNSPPSSTHTSPRKRVSRATLSKQNKSSAAMNGDIPFNSSLDTRIPNLQQPSLNIAANMLPTPAKTPRKKPVQPAAVNAAARVLFPARPDEVEDAMPTPRKRRNKRSASFSLYGSMEDKDGSENQIQIFTDSKDKVPELDTSEDNPFYEKPIEEAHAPDPIRSKNVKKRKARHSIERDKEIEEVFKRGEGMVYVFRGKKIFRKFPQDSPEPGGEEASPSIPHPLTRSSIKPCLLFPTSRQRREREAEAPNPDDEEATTDIEEPQDHVMTDPEEKQPITTPVKKISFNTTTPPITGHATRSSTKKAAMDSSPLEAPEPVKLRYERRGKKISPFDGWARTKGGSVGGRKGKKREAEPMERSEGSVGHKKARSDEAV